MKAYRFGDCETSHNIIIEEDNGDIKVAFVNNDKVVEYLAKPTLTKLGYVRLMFGDGSSMPYKDEKGKLCEKYIEIK